MICENYAEIRITELLKSSRQNFHQANLSFPLFDDIKVCVKRVLETYLEKTLMHRDSEKVFISYRAPYQPVSTATISRWIKLGLAMAGVDMTRFTPHSTRSAAASKGAAAFVPVDNILKVAGWSQESTFRKFYQRPIRSFAFVNKLSST